VKIIQSLQQGCWLTKWVPTHKSSNLRGGGRWGVEHSTDNRELLIAISSLIRSGRTEQALLVLDSELGGGC
jgi:hypothetical protein